MLSRLTRVLVVLLALSSLGASCGQSALAIMPGVINDPANRTLRREIFAFAIDQLCSEMQRRSVPLKLRDPDPNVGRFFPIACNVQQMASENLFVQFLGHGYAWTNVTGRMGFEASAAVEYSHDFRMDGSTMYIYFRQKQTQSSKFQVLMVEKGSDTTVAGVSGVMGTTVRAVSQQVGTRILQHQLARGFTVVRESDGTASFALGMLDQGAAPDSPFARGDSDWQLLANERTELHGGQRDFAGPFFIEDEDDTLWLTALVEGAPTVDYMVIAKLAGDQWIKTYERQPATTPPPAPLLHDEVLQAATAVPGRPATPVRRPLRLPPGGYFIVFDNTATAGKSQPAPVAHDDRAALVSYAIQLGDPP